MVIPVCKHICTLKHSDMIMGTRFSKIMKIAITQKKCNGCEYVCLKTAFNNSIFCPCCKYRFRYRVVSNHMNQSPDSNGMKRMEIKMMRAYS